jgi:hypothetical protein
VASLALAPKTPEIQVTPPTEGRAFGSPLSRGSGYDAVMKWDNTKPESDLAGYVVVMRKTTSPVWEREMSVGLTDNFTLPNVNIDEVDLGIKSVDKQGNESLPVAFVSPAYKQRKVETY